MGNVIDGEVLNIRFHDFHQDKIYFHSHYFKHKFTIDAKIFTFKR